MKIKKGDKVQVISGKYKGVKSEVLKVFGKTSTALVKDVNTVTKHVKKTQNNEGGRFKYDKPILLSKVMLICPSCSKLTRVGYRVEATKKVRYCKKCNKTI